MHSARSCLCIIDDEPFVRFPALSFMNSLSMLTHRSPSPVLRATQLSDVDEGEYDYEGHEAAEVDGDLTVRAVVVGLLVGYVVPPDICSRCANSQSGAVYDQCLLWPANRYAPPPSPLSHSWTTSCLPRPPFSLDYQFNVAGWVSMMSLQSALLGYAIFLILPKLLPSLFSKPFTVQENVILQTTAVATGTMPLAAGLVGIIPALGMMSERLDGVGPIVLGWWGLVGWCLAVAFFGYV